MVREAQPIFMLKKSKSSNVSRLHRVRELKKGEEIDEEELIAEIRIAGLNKKCYNIRAAKHKS